MNVSKIMVFLILFVTFIFTETVEAKKSRSKNRIRKRQQRLRKMKRKNLDNRTRAERKQSKNAFMNSFLTKALEVIEDYDEEYYDEAPIINIRFKRESSKYEDSVLMQKLRPTNV